MKKKTVVIRSPKCFGENNEKNKSCKNCIFLFDCAERKSKKER